MTTTIAEPLMQAPAGPGLITFLRGLWRARTADRLALLEGMRREYGDIAEVRFGSKRIFFVNAPEYLQECLVTRHKDFHKDEGYDFLKELLGNGLLTSEEEFHLRQRRMIQPMFHKIRLSEYGAAMTECAAAARDTWRDGEQFDIVSRMLTLTLDIVGRTLFNTRTAHHAETIAHSMEAMLALEQRYAMKLQWLLNNLPLPSTRRAFRAREIVFEIMARMIEEHRASGDQGDVLSMLLAARDEDDGGGMTDQQVRDEALTLFMAGHETTANALAWTWFCLSRNPECEARMHAEIDSVCAGGRLPAAEDYSKLTYTKQVLSESMRLYPPAYVYGRQAIRDTQLGGYSVPKGANVVMSPYVVHRDERWWPDPLRFDPGRFAPEASGARHKFAYAPFGGGPRLCIGEGFAWMEGVLVLATIGQRWRLRLPANFEPQFDPRVTLRPKGAIPMTAHLR